MTLGGIAFTDSRMGDLAKNFTNPNYVRPTPDYERQRSRSVSESESSDSKNWDRVVEQQARRDQARETVTIPPPSQNESEPAQAKQVSFNDRNYVPRGADNVLKFEEPKIPIQAPNPPEKTKITIVGQKPSMKDRVCGVAEEGSIVKRNCRARVGLNYRD
ncbi:hypothetical protein B9K09_07655 [Pseudomonas sp. M30-35]|nr:hypothetical protein B9K09_07655 [Pseudomonas sp. M30-35]